MPRFQAKAVPYVQPRDMSDLQEAALERRRPGDLCLLLIDQVDEALAHLTRRCQTAT